MYTCVYIYIYIYIYIYVFIYICMYTCYSIVYCITLHYASSNNNVAGFFIHEKHHGRVAEIPKFAGWWGHKKDGSAMFIIYIYIYI